MVDDEEMPRKVACKLLARRYDVVDVGSALEALHLLETKRFDLLITDCEMPAMNGMRLLEICVARWPEMPCMIASGGLTAERRKWLQEHGIPFLEKPYRLQHLLDAVNGLLFAPGP